MKIAIIGAGFSGLSLCYHLLLQGFPVHLFDAKGIGAGASGVSMGLLHPYPGKMTYRSWKAEECLKEARFLLKTASDALSKEVADYSGILRYMQSPEQEKTFSEHEKTHGDVKKVQEGIYLISSGITVDSPLYMEGLWMACEKKGALLHTQKITNINELEGYDAVVIAVGAGVRDFAECKDLPLSFIKGQSIKCKWPKDLPMLEKTIIGNGYITKASNDHCYVGATYERQYSEEGPNFEKAQSELTKKLTTFFPRFSDLKPLECRAGIRVARKGHYLPFAEPLNERCWVLTAMGSRGLLYSGYMAKFLAETMASSLSKNVSIS